MGLYKKLESSYKEAIILPNTLQFLIELGEYSPTDEEICVALTGEVRNNVQVINSFTPFTNSADDKLHKYIPDPLEWLQFIKVTYPFNPQASPKKGFLGIYHTHPQNEAYPSIKDVDGTGYKGIYLIHSPFKNQLHAYWVEKPRAMWKTLNLKVQNI